MGVRWVDLSMYGLAVKVHGQAERNLVLQSLAGSTEPDAEQAARMGFKRRNGILLREGTKIPMSEIQAVFPQARICEIEAADREYVEPANDAPTLDLVPPEVMLPAHWMPQAEFVRRAHVYQGREGWQVDLVNTPMPVPDEVRAMSPRTSVDKIAALVHAHVVQVADNADPRQSRIEVLADYHKTTAGASWYSNRQAETNVTKLLSRLAILPKMMDHVRLEEWNTAHCRLKNPPYQDLAIEIHPDHSGHEHRLYLTHYRDDGAPDGEMVYGLSRGRLWFIETAVMGMRGELRGPDRTFAGMFARNLLAQGFDRAQVEWGGDLAPREDDEPAPALRPAL